METNNLALAQFDSLPAHKAVLKNAAPAIVATIMQLIYNLADTFFIGLTGNDLQIAAVSIAFPVFMLFMATGMVFGIGGTSVISRAYGEGRAEYARNVSAFCMWASVAVGIFISVAFYAFMDKILAAMGANEDMLDYTRSYLVIVAAGGPVILIGSTFSSILRSEGQPRKAMTGQIIGNLLNIILDPILILALSWGISGAAVATVIGSVVSAVYYILHFVSGKSSLSIHPRDFRIRNKVCTSVLSIGIPAALGPLFMSVSQVVMNSMMSVYSSFAVAAVGIASRVSMIISTIALGLGQGIQPLLGYAIGTRNWKRYREYLKSSLIFGSVICVLMTAVCYLFTRQIVGVFLSEEQSFGYSVTFARIMQTTAFMFGVFFCYVNALQAMGAAVSSLIVNVSRQGLVYIPALFALRAILGMNGLIWAQPVADVLSLVFAIVLHTAMFNKLSRNAQVSRTDKSSLNP